MCIVVWWWVELWCDSGGVGVVVSRVGMVVWCRSSGECAGGGSVVLGLCCYYLLVVSEVFE